MQKVTITFKRDTEEIIATKVEESSQKIDIDLFCSYLADRCRKHIQESQARKEAETI